MGILAIPLTAIPPGPLTWARPCAKYFEVKISENVSHSVVSDSL